jgi:hypothetical protein
MYMPKLYDEKKILSYLKKQKKHAWSLESDFSWGSDIDFSKEFVPLPDNFILTPHINENQKILVSQLVGLMINSSICELEGALERSKRQCWTDVINQYPVSPEFEALGENFFVEEKKHSDAFEIFLEKFANQTNVSVQELKSILPTLNESKIEKLFRMNSYLGGKALWMVVAAVEEESIEVYKQMKPHKQGIDPLYFELHQKHFEEETRHASFAFLMLELLEERTSTPVKMLSRQLDYILSEVLQVSWILGELMKVVHLEKLKNRHPFYKGLSELIPVIENFTFTDVLKSLFNDAPFISLILRPGLNKHLSDYLDEQKSLRFLDKVI